MPSPNSELKAQIQVYFFRYFEQVFTSYNFLVFTGFYKSIATTKKTIETILNFKQLNKKFFISVIYNLFTVD